jgi:hypothetical protein
VPFLCFRGYRDSQNIAKAKGRARRGHGEDTRISPGTYLGAFGDVLTVTAVKIIFSVFPEMGIFVDLPLCGIIIRTTTEHRKRWQGFAISRYPRQSAASNP